MIMSQKLSINQTLNVKLDSIEFAYQKLSIRNLSSLMLGKQQIKIPNLFNSIGSSNISDIIMTSQVFEFLFFTIELI